MMSRQNLIDQTEQDDGAELQSLSRKDALYAELKHASWEQIRACYDAWSKEKDENGEQLISVYLSERQSRLCKQRIRATTGFSALVVAISVLNSYMGAYHCDVSPEPRIKLGLYTGLLSIIPAALATMSFGTCISHARSDGDTEQIIALSLMELGCLGLVGGFTRNWAVSMLSNDSRSELEGKGKENDLDAEYLWGFLYSFLAYVVLMRLVEEYMGLSFEEADSADEHRHSIYMVNELKKELDATSMIARDQYGHLVYPDILRDFHDAKNNRDALLNQVKKDARLELRFLRWVISKKGADSLMPPQPDPEAKGLVKAAITESAALNANGGGGGGGGPGYGAV